MGYELDIKDQVMHSVLTTHPLSFLPHSSLPFPLSLVFPWEPHQLFKTSRLTQAARPKNLQTLGAKPLEILFTNEKEFLKHQLLNFPK